MFKPPKGNKQPKRSSAGPHHTSQRREGARVQDGKGAFRGKYASSKGSEQTSEYIYVGGKRQKVTNGVRAHGKQPGRYKGLQSSRSRAGACEYSKAHDGAQHATERRVRADQARDCARGEGRRALAEALDLQAPITTIYVAKSLSFDDELARLLQRATKCGIALAEVSKDRLDRLSAHGAHQGVIFEMPPFEYASLHQIIKEISAQEDALIIVCDHITDEGNLGAIIRSAEVVGAACVVIPSRRSARVGIGAYKTSAGACMHLPIVEVSNISSALKELQEAGFWVAGASEHATTDLWHQRLAGRLVLVMGSEGQGISQLVLKHCDFLVKLPQVGKIESLNVAQATTALAYEWLRQVRARQSE